MRSSICDLAASATDARQARSGVLGADGAELVLDDGEHAFLAGEDVEEVGDRLTSISSYSPFTLSRSRPVSW